MQFDKKSGRFRISLYCGDTENKRPLKTKEEAEARRSRFGSKKRCGSSNAVGWKFRLVLTPPASFCPMAS